MTLNGCADEEVIRFRLGAPVDRLITGEVQTEAFKSSIAAWVVQGADGVKNIMLLVFNWCLLCQSTINFGPCGVNGTWSATTLCELLAKMLNAHTTAQR